MLSQLHQIFGSRTKAQEVLFLLKDAKKVVRQGFYQEELSKIEQFCQENNLFLVKSKFKVLLGEKSHYSNKGMKISGDDSRQGMFFVYLSKDEKKAYLASYYELINNDQELGLLLGYPQCCINFFCQNFNQNNPNLQLIPTNFWTNISKRDQDYVLLSHFPCNSECTESIKLAKKYFEIITDNDQKRAQEIESYLMIKE